MLRIKANPTVPSVPPGTLKIYRKQWSAPFATFIFMRRVRNLKSAQPVPLAMNWKIKVGPNAAAAPWEKRESVSVQEHLKKELVSAVKKVGTEAQKMTSRPVKSAPKDCPRVVLDKAPAINACLV